MVGNAIFFNDEGSRNHDAAMFLQYLINKFELACVIEQKVSIYLCIIEIEGEFLKFVPLIIWMIIKLVPNACGGLYSWCQMFVEDYKVGTKCLWIIKLGVK